MPEHPITTHVLERFRQVCAHPRRSNEEGRIVAWLITWARQHDLPTRQDAKGNLVIAVPASPGAEHAPTVVLQGHLDMVCEAEPGSLHDFSRDPIRPVQRGDWLCAEGTSLGADNGIAVAIAMVLATSPDVVHPPLELLFTVDEEIGMSGALELDPALLTGRVMLNLDGEDEGVLTVGCAGGIDTLLRVPFPGQAAVAEHVGFTLLAGDMVGGHSGIDIHLQRANAIRVLARALGHLVSSVDLFIVDVVGGTALNAIPRRAQADFQVSARDVPAVQAALAAVQKTLTAEFAATDPTLFLRLLPAERAAERTWTAQGSRDAIDLLLAVPHGVSAMSADVPGLVETSNNTATANRDGDALVIQSSQRSSLPSGLIAMTARVESVGRAAGGDTHTGNGYPPWPPNLASPLLARCQRIYEARFGVAAKVEIMHAGLECGVIGERVPGMDMIALGPTIRSPHSPAEKLHVPAVGKVWDFVVDVLADLAQAPGGDGSRGA